MYNGPRMLMTRNLIYTAVTRARACVCLVGQPDALDVYKRQVAGREHLELGPYAGWGKG